MNTSGKTTILIVDDHRHIHEAVTLALSVAEDFEIAGHCNNGEEAHRLCQTLRPHVVLMDVVMPIMDGVQATHHIHKQFPDILILALSSYDDDESVREMLRNGAAGFIPKDNIPRGLVNTIRASLDGNTVLPGSMKVNLIRPGSSQPRKTFGLSARELEVLRHVSEGLINAQIAESLSISQSTVKFHLSNILHKMDVETRAEAIVLAVKNGLV